MRDEIIGLYLPTSGCCFKSLKSSKGISNKPNGEAYFSDTGVSKNAEFESTEDVVIGHPKLWNMEVV